ncbi:hypothetical protein E2C01_101725 [Portunus trituberculatus]|uniref:Uncharacterized protein n=1 Tax=Portunus trituberculatus TaxID=210409 RepID=A0A5B7KFL4_PORTR|nr:hypothetical protein [Portunus trituberculatus]
MNTLSSVTQTGLFPQAQQAQKNRSGSGRSGKGQQSKGHTRQMQRWFIASFHCPVTKTITTKQNKNNKEYEFDDTNRHNLAASSEHALD